MTMHKRKFIDYFLSPAINSALVLGIILRITEFVNNRSLWFDEANVANQILAINFIDIFNPLSTNLGYPISFIFIEKLFVNILGTSEYAFRLFPLLCGIGSLIIFCITDLFHFKNLPYNGMPSFLISNLSYI